MTTAFLNGDYMALDEARISPMDRGFLFGDGIYEIIPVHDGKPIGFSLHIDRMKKGLSAVEINLDWSHDKWRDICDKLVDKNGAGNLAVYLQVSRGADTKRHHAYPKGITPTGFGFASELAASLQSERTAVTPLKISSAEDQRWRRCDIKSTALLGNIIHFQKGQAEGNDETLLFNAADEVTEGSATNVFVVKDGVISTPPLDHQVLPGVTRLMLLDMLRKDGSVPVEERVVTMEEARQADEIWLTSSTREVAPVVRLDGIPVGSGEAGPLWTMAYRLFTDKKFDY
ncbi:MAG: D-alanine aminotransferase [Woeseiaceae bacterium]|nr:D-alanine aminotransferase [Woeseiaceae bacterium]